MLYPNDCDHKEEEFYGTVEIEGRKYDLYFFKDKYAGWEYCLRFGDMGDYASMPLKYIVPNVGDEIRPRDEVVWKSFIEFASMRLDFV